MKATKLFLMSILLGGVFGGAAWAVCSHIPTGGWVCNCDGTCKIVCDEDITHCESKQLN